MYMYRTMFADILMVQNVKVMELVTAVPQSSKTDTSKGMSTLMFENEWLLSSCLYPYGSCNA